MLVDFPDAIYVCALKHYRELFSTPDEQIEFWSRFGKAVLDNTEVEPAVVFELVLARMQKNLDSTTQLRNTGQTGDSILETPSFTTACNALPATTRPVVDLALDGLLTPSNSDNTLLGELGGFSLRQWGAQSQLFQVGYLRNDLNRSITLLAMARKYIGM